MQCLKREQRTNLRISLQLWTHLIPRMDITETIIDILVPAYLDFSILLLSTHFSSCFLNRRLRNHIFIDLRQISFLWEFDSAGFTSSECRSSSLGTLNEALLLVHSDLRMEYLSPQAIHHKTVLRPWECMHFSSPPPLTWNNVLPKSFNGFSFWSFALWTSFKFH